MRKSIILPLLIVALAAAPLSAEINFPGRLEITRETVLAQMNEFRAQHGLGPLQLEERLNGAAEDRMRDMEDLAYWSHESPDGRSPFVWVKVRGYAFSAVGENLASGFETAEVLVGSWMESKGHRDNILSTEFSDCGIAIIDGSTTRRAEGKSIVVMFGRERGARLTAAAK